MRTPRRRPSARRPTRARVVLAAGIAALTGCGATAEREAASRGESPSTAPAAAAAGVEGRGAATCSAGTVERRPLVLADGLHAYVEPSFLLRIGDDFVVVGSPSYTWEVGGDTARMVTEKAHIGVYLDDEDPLLVPNPFGAEVGFVRAVALDDGRWGVLGSYRERDELVLTRTTALLYGEYDGSWTALEEVPLPPEGANVGTSSNLVRSGEELVWVAVDQSGVGGVYEYRRTADGWRFQRIFERGLEAAALDVGPSGLWLAVKGLDPGVEGPRKSVRLFHWDDGWRFVVRDPTVDTYTEIDNPELTVLPGGAAVTWIERVGPGLARARVGVLPDRQGSTVLLDEAAPFLRSFSAASGAPAWVLQHVDEAARAAELRVVVGDSEGGDVRPRVVQTLPLPFTGFFDALAVGPASILVTGAEFSPDPARATVRSLTLRLSPSCR